MRKPIHEAVTTVESAFDDLKGLVGPAAAHRSAALRGRAAGRAATQAVIPQPATPRPPSPNSPPSSTSSKRAATRILTPFLLLLMYPLQTALAAERWRSIHGAVIHSWLDVLGEFEALLSLARYCYEHPADPFPEFLDGAPAFRATQLGHPLIPRRGARLQ